MARNSFWPRFRPLGVPFPRRDAAERLVAVDFFLLRGIWVNAARFGTCLLRIVDVSEKNPRGVQGFVLRGLAGGRFRADARRKSSFSAQPAVEPRRQFSLGRGGFSEPSCGRFGILLETFEGQLLIDGPSRAEYPILDSPPWRSSWPSRKQRSKRPNGKDADGRDVRRELRPMPHGRHWRRAVAGQTWGCGCRQIFLAGLNFS
jgi:hypothetical protein